MTTIILTASAIDEMEAGTVLDVVIAKRVMDWKPMYLTHIFGTFEPRIEDGPPDLLDYYSASGNKIPCGWSPSTDIAAAWEVLGKFNSFELHHYPKHTTNKYKVLAYECRVTRYKPEGTGRAYGETAPLAICRAALKAAIAQTAIQLPSIS